MMSAYHNTVKLNTWISNQFIISAFLRDKCCCYLNINTYSWLTFLNISKLWHGAMSHNLLSDIIKGAVFKRGHALCDWSSTVLLTLSPRALLLDFFFHFNFSLWDLSCAFLFWMTDVYSFMCIHSHNQAQVILLKRTLREFSKCIQLKCLRNAQTTAPNTVCFWLHNASFLPAVFIYVVPVVK